MLAFDILLRLVGAFYVLAGLVGLRTARVDQLLDTAISALKSAGPPPAPVRHKSAFLASLSVMVLAGGALLIVGSQLAVPVFVATLFAQWLLIAWLGPRYFDLHDPPTEAGRRQTINAASIYAAATALVVVGLMTGRLDPVSGDSLPFVAAALAVVVLVAIKAVNDFRWRIK